MSVFSAKVNSKKSAIRESRLLEAEKCLQEVDACREKLLKQIDEICVVPVSRLRSS